MCFPIANRFVKESLDHTLSGVYADFKINCSKKTNEIPDLDDR
jgi:hypothetical protein